MQTALVVGSGGIGLLTALMLARHHIKVTLIGDAESAPKIGELGYGLQTLTLSQSTVNYLELLGIKLESAHAFQEMLVEEQIGFSSLAWNANQYDWPFLGYVIESHQLISVLWGLVKQSSLIEVVTDRVVEFKKHSTVVECYLKEGEKLSADYLFACDGGRSFFRNQINADPLLQFCGHAFSGVVSGCDALWGKAWQMFSSQSIGALMPLKQVQDKCYYSLVFSSSEEKADLIESVDRFLEIHAPIRIDSRDQHYLTFPLYRYVAKQWTYEETVFLLGDAARLILPLAGQGFNLGVEDILCLDRLFSLKARQNISNQLFAQAYQQERRGRSLLFDRLIAGLMDFYAQPDIRITLLRNYGVKWINDCHFIKAYFAEVAQGKYLTRSF